MCARHHLRKTRLLGVICAIAFINSGVIGHAEAASVQTERGVRVSGEDLKKLLPGYTLHGKLGYTEPGKTVDFNISVVEFYDSSGDLTARFSPPIFDNFGNQQSLVLARWEVRGDLLCYFYDSPKFFDDCVEVYRKDISLQFFDRQTGNIFYFTTRIVK